MSGRKTSPDVVIVGAGMAGIYGVIRLRRAGFSVLCVEAASDVGGVWFHNNYPGSRVDLESDTFCYFFDEVLYKEWNWSERYAPQSEVLEYLRHVADRFEVRKDTWLDTRVVSAQWLTAEDRWRIETEGGDVITPRFLISAAGQLSRPRDPDVPGLADFAGDWYQTSRWPNEPVDLTGKRVGVIGTGSSGVQTITEVAKTAGHLTVFQRTPHYSMPANNRAPDLSRRARLRERFPDLWHDLAQTHFGGFLPPPAGSASDFSIEDQYALMQQRWDFGSQAMNGVFTDQGTNEETNALVSEFVRNKVRESVKDPRVRSIVVPDAYPMGTKRLILDTGYYEVYAQENVALVDLRADPIERITSAGIQTRQGHVDLDVIIFAIGFEAFTGGLDELNIRNEAGISPSQAWVRGPQTYLGLMTTGFPNLLMITGPGSPSVLTNMFVGSQHHMNVVADLLSHMRSKGLARVEPTQHAQQGWVEHSAELAGNLIRRQVNQYMVHVNEDGSRVFIPYTGGFKLYNETVQGEVGSGFPGFTFA